MTKLEKARDLYLRGFKTKQIRNKTGISLHELRDAFGKITSADIRKYQTAYIQSHYSKDDIVQAFEQIRQQGDPTRKAASKNLQVLGCVFGDFVKVFKTLLGEDVYKEITYHYRTERFTKTMLDRYGVTSSMYLPEMKEKRKQTMVNRYGVEQPNQSPEIKEKMMKQYRNTMRERYGVDYPMLDPERAAQAAIHRQEKMQEQYGAANSVQIPEIRQKIQESRAKHKTLSSSKMEQTLYDLLVEHFGEEDVKWNQRIDDRYPFYVDFYIPSRDLFIELNAYPSHRGHWFDPESKHDRQVLRSLQENAARKRAETGKVSKYEGYIRTWTVLDVEKRKKAKENHLSYLVFWDNQMIMRNKKQFPRLKDAREWFAEGCPDPKDWRPENTY